MQTRKLLLILAILLMTSLVVSAVPFACAMTPSHPLLAFRFDDGCASSYTLAKPLLDMYNIKGLFAIITGKVNSTWETIPTMTWAQLQTLKSAGHQIISHGCDHIHLINTTEANIIHELEQSQKDILGNLSFTTKTFAYPYGLTNATVKIYVSAYYDYVSYGSTLPFLLNSTDPLEIPRYLSLGVYANKTNEETILTTMKTKIDALVTAGKGYASVLGFHHITDTPRGGAYQDVTPYVLDETLKYARTKDISIVPFSTICNYIGTASSMTSTINAWLPDIICLAMFGIACGLLTKLKFK